jgi:hypothetical protein
MTETATIGIDTIETESESRPPSVFHVAAYRCPPSYFMARGVLLLADHFMPDATAPDPITIQADGTPIPNWECWTAILHLKRIIGVLHPLITELQHALRDELK